MGNSISSSSLGNVFQSSTSLSNSSKISESTKRIIRTLFDALIANPRNTSNRLSGLLSQIPRNENILCCLDSSGYNLLQICIGLNNIDMVKWILARNPDLNRGACSLPLHIACSRGLYEIVELLLKHGARTDVEGRLCWPGHHSTNCEGRSKLCTHLDCLTNTNTNTALHDRQSNSTGSTSDKLQNGIYYSIDGDHPEILDLLTQRSEERRSSSWRFPFNTKRPLLHIACERGAWNCVTYLLNERADEINQCYDEYYPIHQAVLHDLRFVEKLITFGANPTVRTATQQMTLLHVLFLLGKKSADDALSSTKFLIEHGLRELINEADSLGNTPLHALIVRYALEESRFGLYQDYIPWSKWDMLHITRYLLQQGAKPSINQPGNSALACVLRHIRDLEFRYELISMLLAEGGNPNIVGRDGSVPLMVTLVPLINKDLLLNFTHNMKVFYLNCVRTLLRHGANPNCSSRSHLTPLHVLMFAAGEYMGLTQSEEKEYSFAFIRQLLVVLLQHGLDPNVHFSSRTEHILLSLLEMVLRARSPPDLDYVYDLSLTLIQFGANPNINITSNEPMICHSQSSFFLKKSSNKVLYYYVQWLCRKETLLLDPEKKFIKIIRLYTMSMEHSELYPSLKSVYNLSLTPARAPLCIALKAAQSNIRTLQQQCRVVIYNCLGRSPGLYASKLPLPPSLIKYLSSFE